MWKSKIPSFITRSGRPLSHIAKQTVTGLAPGSYKVFIFDWERDGSVPSTPSYVGHVNFTGPEPDLPSSVSPTKRKLP